MSGKIKDLENRFIELKAAMADAYEQRETSNNQIKAIRQQIFELRHIVEKKIINVYDHEDVTTKEEDIQKETSKEVAKNKAGSRKT